tara:strand:+ start:3679 stop:7119 length:3441 start_codon:yes stop_codon:yes gene_type:complete
MGVPRGGLQTEKDNAQIAFEGQPIPGGATQQEFDLINRSFTSDIPLTAEEEDQLSAIPQEKTQAVRSFLDKPAPTTMSMQYTPESARFTGNVTDISGDTFEAGPVTQAIGTVADPIATGLRATGVEDALMGLGSVLAFLPDAAINTISRGLEAAGIVEPGTVDRDIIERLLNAGDYESAKIIVPYLLAYGQGQEIGTTKGLGRYGRTAGEFAGMAVPFAGAMQKGANLTRATPEALEQLAKSTGRTVDDIPAAERYIGMLDPRTGVNLTAIGQTPTTTTRVGETIMAPYRLNPQSAYAMEMGLATVSGLGYQLEEDLYGTNTGIGAMAPLAPFVAWYAIKNGPVASSFRWLKDKTPQSVKDLGSNMPDRVDDLKVALGSQGAADGERGATALAGINREIAEQSATPEGVEQIQLSQKIERAFGPYADTGQTMQLSPAERTGSPNLIVTEQGAVFRGTPEFVNANIQRKNRTWQAAQNYIDGNFTGTGIDDTPLYIIDDVTGKYSVSLATIDGQLDDVTDSLAILANSESGVYPRYDAKHRAELGRDMRSSVMAWHTQAKEDAAQVAKNLGINDADELLDPTAFRESRMRMRARFQNANGTESLDYGGLPSQVKSYIENPNDMLSFQEWKNFRDQVGSAIGAASAKGDKTAVRNLAILSDELDDIATGFGKLNEDFEGFRVYYNQNVIEPFERYGTLRITAKGAGSTPENPTYIIPDEQVAGAFLENSNTTAEFAKMFGDDQRMMGRMVSVVLDDLRNKAYAPSKSAFTPERVNSYINDNSEKLRFLTYNGKPLDEALQDTQLMIEAQVARQAELQARRQAIETNSLYQTIANNAGNPEAVINNAIRNPSQMAELMKMATKGLGGAAKAQREKTIRRAVWSAMTRDIPDIAESPEAFIRFLDKNNRSLVPAFGQEHLDNLYLAAELARKLRSTGRSREGTPISPFTIFGDEGQLEALTGTSVRSMTTLARATAEGRISPFSAIAYLFSRGVATGSNLRTDAIIREMIFDPEITSLLINKKVNEVGQIKPADLKAINRWLFESGINYSVNDQMFGTDPQPQTFDLLMEDVPEEEINETQLQFQGVQPPLAPPQASVTPPVTPPVMAPTPSASAPNAPIQPTASELFPNDPTLAAIERRRPAQGIASLA